ncbi:MAG: ABC transporter permease [Planctomycetota bacterium]
MTFLLETIKLGINNLRLQLLRSILTALGIIFGVAAVITMVGIGEGSTQQALAEIERLGARNIIARSQKPAEAGQNGGGGGFSTLEYGITRADLEVVLAQPGFEGARIVPLKEVGSEVLQGPLRKVSQAYGTTPDLLDVARLRVAKGRYLVSGDVTNTSLVCVIGHEIARQLFVGEEPLGQTLQIDDKYLEIVGVLEPVGLAGGAGASLVGRDLNLDVHMPITTAVEVFGDTVTRRGGGSLERTKVEVAEIYLESPTRDLVLSDSARLRRILESRHPGMTDIEMIVPRELLETARKRALTGQWISGAIAGISLLVGGIGIMNIMLATVTERTREIGIRRALGATRKHIVSQFLVETGVLGATGGLIGVALGVGLSLALKYVVPLLPQTPIIGKYVPADVELPTTISVWSIIVAFIVAALTGLVFGLYPARKAAKQDPIVALRHD